MIGWIDERLVFWGTWIKRREDGGLGYPRQSPTFRQSAGSAVSGGLLLVESDALQIDGVMVQVKKQRPELYTVAREWYVAGSPVGTVAARVCCHRNSVKRLLGDLHLVVDGALSDMKKQR